MHELLTCDMIVSLFYIPQQGGVEVEEGCFHCPSGDDRGQIASALIPFGFRSLKTHRGLQDRFLKLTMDVQETAE